MSRSYSVGMTVSDVRPGEVRRTLLSISEEYYSPVDITKTDNYEYHKKERELIIYNSDGSIGGGREEKEVATDIAKAVWKALGRFVRVSVNMLCLENLPYETYEMDEEEYQEAVADRLEGKE